MHPDGPRNEPAWRARLGSFGCAFRGLGLLVARELHPKVHAAATIAVALLGWRLGISPMEWCAVTLAVGAVWTAEAFNSAIEALVDLVSPEIRPLAGLVKDLAAGAVLAAAIAAMIVGALIFVPKL